MIKFLVERIELVKSEIKGQLALILAVDESRQLMIDHPLLTTVFFDDPLLDDILELEEESGIDLMGGSVCTLLELLDNIIIGIRG